MDRPINILIPVAFALAGMTALLAGCKSNSAPEQPEENSSSSSQTARMRQEEAAVAKLLAGKSLQGKVVLVEFGMIGCPLSGEGLNEMIALSRDDSVAGLNFLRVETSGDDQAVESYYKDKKPSFAVYRDKEGKLAGASGATVTPTFMLVDKYGHIRYTGSFPRGQIEKWAKLLLAESSDPGADFTPLGVKKLDYAKLLGQTTLAGLDGGKIRLIDATGNAGLILFFGDTSCPFSEQALGEFPTIAAVLSKYGIPAVIINIEDEENSVRNYYQTHKPGLPILYDPTAATSAAWNITSVPTIVYIKADGNAGYFGKATWADLAVGVEDSLGLARGSVKFTAEGTSYG